MRVVIDVYNFGQEFFIIGIYWKLLCKYLKMNLVKAAKNAFLQRAKKYMQPAQIKLHTDKKFSTPGKNSTPIFCRADKKGSSQHTANKCSGKQYRNYRSRG